MGRAQAAKPPSTDRWGHHHELDCIGNVRRLRTSKTFPTGTPPSQSDLGGYRYSAFGKLKPPDAGTPSPAFIHAPLLDQPLRWQGRWYLDIAGGAYDFRARVWSPEIGGFLQADELGFVTPGTTLWSWPHQNAFVYSDPLGYGPIDDLQRGLNKLSDLPIVGFVFAGPAAFGRGVQNRVLGTIKLANDATVEEGLAQRSRGNCQIAIGGAASGATAAVLSGLGQAALRRSPEMVHFCSPKMVHTRITPLARANGSAAVRAVSAKA